MKALQILKTALAVVGLFALGILTGAFLFRKPAAGKDGEAQKAKEEKKNELLDSKSLQYSLSFSSTTNDITIGIANQLNLYISYRIITILF